MRERTGILANTCKTSQEMLTGFGEFSVPDKRDYAELSPARPSPVKRGINWESE
jgi:hypothetical protein